MSIWDMEEDQEGWNMKTREDNRVNMIKTCYKMYENVMIKFIVLKN